MEKTRDEHTSGDGTGAKESEQDSGGLDQATEGRTPWDVAAMAKAPKTVEAETPGDHFKRPPRLSIAVEVDLESENCFYSGLTENLSEGGIFVATYDLKPVGTQFDISLTLQDLPPIQAKAEVRWIRDGLAASRDHAVGMGMSFVDLDDDDLATIQAFMECRISLYMEGV